VAAFTRRLLVASSVAALASRTLAWAQGRRGGAPQPAPPVSSATPDTDWLHYANDLASTRYAALDQINAANFNKLEMAWRFSTSSLNSRPDFAYPTTPLLVRGRIYVTAGGRRDVVCLDGRTGELLWMHREDEGERTGARPGPGWGVSYWTDGTNERILYVTIGYRLISLDAKTGIPDPHFGENGVVDLRKDDDQEMDLEKADIGLHASPTVARNTVIVGAALSSGDIPKTRFNVKGYVRGFDVKTGKRKWIFHTIPRKGEFGYESWIEPGQAEQAGNAGSWAQMSADEELGLVYVGVELPTGDENGQYRKGPALFGTSLVALDIETGQRKWHYQMVHHDLWDRDVPCAAILCDIPHNGKIVKALAQPSKQAYLYVLNRETGQPVWPIPEKPVPKGDVPGEWYSPTQPMPSKPPAFDRQGVTKDDLADFTPAIKARALEIASHYRFGPLYMPPTMSRPEGPWGSLALPGLQGGCNWPGGSYDPETHMVYVFSKTEILATGIIPNNNRSVSDFDYVHGTTGQVITARGGPGGGGGGGRGGGEGATADALNAPITPTTILSVVPGIPLAKPPYGRITALDLKDGTLAWQVVHGETPDAIRNHPLLKGVNIPRTGQVGIIGPLTTKTLVIAGDSGVFTDETGRRGARLRAYDKATGEEKGAVFLPAQHIGAPMTYMLGGQQYIVLAVGGSGYSAELLAFKLPA
jgi:quinoprotein glucose dehydrogenase